MLDKFADSEDKRKQLGSYVRGVLELRGRSAYSLTTRGGVSPASIYRLLNGEGIGTFEFLGRIADQLNVRPGELLDAYFGLQSPRLNSSNAIPVPEYFGPVERNYLDRTLKLLDLYSRQPQDAEDLAEETWQGSRPVEEINREALDRIADRALDLRAKASGDGLQ
jgi:transcriptional regulator with XRE-family HTH domain